MTTKRRRKKEEAELAELELETTETDDNKHQLSRPIISARNDSQKGYIRAVKYNDFIVCNGPAGTGKTHIAIAMALDHLYRGLVEKIIVARPVVEAGESLGFLPGGLEEKMAPYIRPIFDELGYYISLDSIQMMQFSGILEICPIAYMRGRTFNKAFIICDECQNASEGQIEMMFTRLGLDSKMVMTGDVTQSDLNIQSRGAFQRLYDRFNTESLEKEGIVTFKFDERDIVRNPKIGIMLKAYRKLVDKSSST